MQKAVHIDTIREHLATAKERLSHEKTAILTENPLPEHFSAEEYAFAYIRAERMGLKIISHYLEALYWLPMHLDPLSEMGENRRAQMAKWIKHETHAQPAMADFGNDFIHALARSGIMQGFESPHCANLSIRIAELFRDLSCLIGVVYYCSFMTEIGISKFPLSQPDNLLNTALELTSMINNVAVQNVLASKQAKEKAEKATKKAREQRNMSHLRLVKNDLGFAGMPAPPPATDHPPLH